MTTTKLFGLKAIATNAQLHEYIATPTLAESCPTEQDGRDHLRRLLSDDPKMNWCRPVDQVNVIRAVAQNYGTDGSVITASVEKDGLVMLIGLPSPDVLFDIVWKLVPDFVKSKVTQWAKANMDGPIATEIAGYVKQALRLLPLPIPAFFVNAVTNLVIPPLVSFIISKLAATQIEGFSLRLDDRDSRIDLEQFYQSDVPNGCKSLQLTQLISAQLRTNPQSDPDPDTFGMVIWKALDADTKTKAKQYARADPPNKAALADLLYTPIRDILQLSPYSVPSPILDTFTSMKAPEVTEYIIFNQG
ncbi:hypothetical protein CPB84DRAFT_1828999 [Gymnopilus junonius]|uniref:Uncharacterized protein n=1 Tax=Gymnopilus junonius TaxID=109634 RepID=A0A9P5TG15_GYMJU|nr:hypothetical protein CPB84DRAFT_1828999 [Gymnopilus junonius]